MKAVAKLRNCPTSPRKMRLIIDAIRGRNVFDAFGILKYIRKGESERVEKLLRSAVSNWEAKNDGYRAEDSELYISEAKVDSGRQTKRLRPAPFGRAHRIRKRSNHVTLVIDSKVAIALADDEVEVLEEEVVETKTTAKKAAKATAAAASKKKKKDKKIDKTDSDSSEEE